MKSINYLSILFLFLLFSCSSLSKSTSEKHIDIPSLVNSKNYVFHAEYVIPSSAYFTPKQLTSDYQLKVTSDTISANLPYYGVAYSAPLNTSDVGINFTSTTFDYVISSKNNNLWTIKIYIKDKPTPISLILQIWNNGKAYLSVKDMNKQNINYQGYISNN